MKLVQRQLRLSILVILTISAILAPSAVNAQAVQAQITVQTCAKGYYKNSKGTCTRSPNKAPAWPSGASAKCVDGTYSFSQSRRGTCSHHGGVSVWR